MECLSGLETDILELRHMITLAAMAFEEDKRAAAFCIYDARDRAEDVKVKYGEFWHKALKQAGSLTTQSAGHPGPAQISVVACAVPTFLNDELCGSD